LLIDGGMEMRNTAPAIVHTAARREMRVLSVMPATSASNAATSDRYAAPNRPAKKRKPHSQPPGMPANPLGIVEKSSVGPAVGSSPSANTAGMIASPATSAEPVSPITVQMAGVATLSVSFRYE